MDNNIHIVTKVEPIKQEYDSKTNNDNYKDFYEIKMIENELFNWFDSDQKNIEIYRKNPIRTLKTVTSASDEILNSFKKITSNDLEKSDFAYGHDNFTVLPLKKYSISPPVIKNTIHGSLWEQSLPHTGNNIISVVSYGSFLYAAGNGYLYKLDGQTGKILKNNDLSGRGKHEIRMTISKDGKDLYLGTDGHALKIETHNLSTVWQKSLKHTGSNVISVLLDNNVLFAAGDGYVYKLNTSNGEQEASNDLPKRGNHEIRLSLSKKGDILYVGTDGYAISMTATELHTRWQTPLKNTGNNPVSLLVENDYIYAGSHGYVYMLDSQGNVVTSNDLPNRGNHDVRMTIGKVSGKNVLFVGTDGYALSLSLTSLKTNWQTSLPNTKDNIVNLLFGNNTLYAGSYGYIYQLKPATGTITYCNNLPNRGNHEVRLTLSKGNAELFAGTDGYAIGLPSCGDLAAGWDAIFTIQKNSINEFFQKDLKKAFLFVNNNKINGLTIKTPQITEEKDDALKLRIGLHGELSTEDIALKKISGYIETIIDLKKLQGELQPSISGENEFVLTVNPTEDDVFKSVDLSNLFYKTTNEQTLSEQELEETFRKLLYYNIHHFFSKEIELKLSFPINYKKYLKFTFVKADNGETYLAIMAAKQLGNFHLSSKIIPNTKNTTGSIIVSNRSIMETLEEVFNNGEYPFSLSNNYPAILSNDHEIPIPGKASFNFHINKNDFEVYFEDNHLKVKITLKYWGIATFGIHYPAYLYLDFFTSIDENGNIVLKAEGTTEVPWTSFISPVPIVGIILGILLKVISPEIQDKLNEIFKNGLTIPIPHFSANYINTPAYVQIGGKWLKQGV